MSEKVRALVRQYLPDFPLHKCGRLYTDTTEFMSIDYGDVIRVGGLHYMVMKNEAERRFGLEDPKYWVKRCRVLETGERKILKLEFYETFPMKVGRLNVECFRSPEKETRILELIKGNKHFMQGETFMDEAGRNIRVLDIVYGRRLDMTVDRIQADHHTYFTNLFPTLLRNYMTAIEAIGELHNMGERHGDIRRDHLYIEFDTDVWRWIDFDYAFRSYENPFGLDLFGLGNILVFLTGKANITIQSLPSVDVPQSAKDSITMDDMSIVIPNRIVNLQKLYPYIPDSLNRVLLHFSEGNTVYYSTVDELLEDLHNCLADLPAPQSSSISPQNT